MDIQIAIQLKDPTESLYAPSIEFINLWHPSLGVIYLDWTKGKSDQYKDGRCSYHLMGIQCQIDNPDSPFEDAEGKLDIIKGCQLEEVYILANGGPENCNEITEYEICEHAIICR